MAYWHYCESAKLKHFQHKMYQLTERDNLSKILLVMRHAKSSWSDGSLADHDRPLNPRGLRDAPRMALWLRDNDSSPDIILSSTANRAASTANIVESNCGSSPTLIEYKSLYLGSPGDYLRLLGQLTDEIDTAMVVGHNPGLESLINQLTGRWETMPTAAVAKINLKIDRWLTVANTENAELIDVSRPKEID